ncbi:hypothetical protein LCGC14_1287460 [marine sediment metagenome]|uniref:Uncharacterized protein n=1 Tax=marine sediment metagenome TaxID=412755 RepID=A0A0F9LEC8_9ZZZZ
MIIWILESDSGVKLLYKSFLKTNADEDIVSGFLTAFHHFSMVEFNQSIDSIEMGGLRWVYILEPKYNLLFVAANTKKMKTEILKTRLNVIKNAFTKEFNQVWEKKGHNWDGNINIFLPFLQLIEDYYSQWEEVETLTQVADFFDILGVFQNIFIMLGKVIENRMYANSRKEVLNLVAEKYNSFKKREDYKKMPELSNISFSKESWFNIIDINLIKCDKEMVIRSLKYLLTQVVTVLKDVKGDNLCLKYFREEDLYGYIFNNMDLLNDLNLNKYLLELFLIL